MNRITKWVAVAMLAVAGLTFNESTASAAVRTTPVQTAYRVNHGGRYHGGWHNNYHHRHHNHYRGHRR